MDDLTILIFLPIALLSPGDHPPTNKLKTLDYAGDGLHLDQYSVYTHVTSIYANLLKQKEAFTQEKSSTTSGFVWYTNMAAVLLFWNTNMAAVTLFENAL